MIMHEIPWRINHNHFHIFTDENLCFDAHFHTAIEFCYVMEGEVEFTVDAVTYTAVKGEAVVAMPNQAHSIKTRKYSKLKFIQVTPDVTGYFYTEYKNKIPENNKFTVPDASLIDMPIIPVPNIYRVKAIAYLLISCLCEQCSNWKEKRSELTIVEDMLVIAETDFSSDITLKTIAQRLGYNYAYLSRIFCTSIGMNFSDYLNNCRINQACYMLKNTDKPITEIAYEVGYKTLRSFNRNFLKYAQQTPLKYRLSVDHSRI